MKIYLLAILIAATIDAAARPNPFARPNGDLPGGATSTAAPPELRLRAVMPAKRSALANINGELVAIGERYLGYELVAVTTRGVTLKRAGQTIELELRAPNLDS